MANEIQLKFTESQVQKTYLYKTPQEHKTQQTKYLREVVAYQKFTDLGANFVPKLLYHDEKNLTLHIEKVEGDHLVKTLQNNSCINVENLIEQLITIDAFLYQNNINYLHCSPHDIIYNVEKKKLFIIDFEYTFLHRYKQILYRQIVFHPRLLRAKGEGSCTLFIDTLHKNKGRFQHYYYRRWRNTFIALCRSRLGHKGKLLLK